MNESWPSFVPNCQQLIRVQWTNQCVASQSGLVLTAIDCSAKSPSQSSGLNALRPKWFQLHLHWILIICEVQNPKVPRERPSMIWLCPKLEPTFLKSYETARWISWQGKIGRIGPRASECSSPGVGLVLNSHSSGHRTMVWINSISLWSLVCKQWKVKVANFITLSLELARVIGEPLSDVLSYIFLPDVLQLLTRIYLHLNQICSVYVIFFRNVGPCGCINISGFLKIQAFIRISPQQWTLKRFALMFINAQKQTCKKYFNSMIFLKPGI